MEPTIDKRSEHQEICSIDDLQKYRHIILGEQFGVGLRMHASTDPHVCFTLLTEDDGHWFPPRGDYTSSAWLEDLIKVTAKAKAWCEANCDPHMYQGHQYGWKFRLYLKCASEV